MLRIPDQYSTMNTFTSKLSQYVCNACMYVCMYGQTRTLYTYRYSYTCRCMLMYVCRCVQHIYIHIYIWIQAESSKQRVDWSWSYGFGQRLVEVLGCLASPHLNPDPPSIQLERGSLNGGSSKCPSQQKVQSRVSTLQIPLGVLGKMDKGFCFLDPPAVQEMWGRGVEGQRNFGIHCVHDHIQGLEVFRYLRWCMFQTLYVLTMVILQCIPWHCDQTIAYGATG